MNFSLWDYLPVSLEWIKKCSAVLILLTTVTQAKTEESKTVKILIFVSASIGESVLSHIVKNTISDTLVVRGVEVVDRNLVTGIFTGKPDWHNIIRPPG